MSLNRKSFIGSIFAAFFGLAFTKKKSKLVEKFEVEILMDENGNYQANLKTAGIIALKTCSIQSAALSPEQDPKAWAEAVRCKFIMDASRAIAIHVFPNDEHLWPDWNRHGYGYVPRENQFGEVNAKLISLKWPPSTISDGLDPHWHKKYTEWKEEEECKKENIAARFVEFMKNWKQS